MPHITIDYSRELEAAFDRRAFVRELHPMVLARTGSAGVCKTFCRPAAETYAGEGEAGPVAFVHVEVGLLPGRPEPLKARLAEQVLALLDKHLPAAARPGGEVIRSAEIRDLAASYRLRNARRAVPVPHGSGG
ncbi:5-carboxymethyl-2-hydroxymuconate Delta-isomerase [Streptomyces albus]|uniref:5-carboxymethyl-2-hydroxymuconate Delta-isomerase n=1 Tax=Streptomyces albus TaxID=1888 RepID=UPI0036F85608